MLFAPSYSPPVSQTEHIVSYYAPTVNGIRNFHCKPPDSKFLMLSALPSPLRPLNQPETIDFIGSNCNMPRISPPATSPSPAQKKPSAAHGLTHPRARLGDRASEAERSAKSDPKQGAEICWANYEISFGMVSWIATSLLCDPSERQRFQRLYLP